MASGRPSPPCEGCDEQDEGYESSGGLVSVGGVLLAAPLDVVGRRPHAGGGRRAAVCAAQGTERRDAAGT